MTRIDRSSSAVSTNLSLWENLFRDGVEPRFQILRRIGHGAFGEVFEAKDLLTGAVVALKRIYVRQPQRGISKSTANEVAVLRNLHSDHIVRLLDSGYLTLVFEHCRTDLAMILRERSGQPQNSAVATSYAKQILQGLTLCHSKGIVHRDLKPSNILMDSNGCVKLGDFGQARFLDRQGQATTPTVTSRWYRAPELLFSSRRYDASVDIWALGAIYFELLTGRAFLPGESDLDQISLMIQTLGTIDEEDWPEVRDLPDYGKIFFESCQRRPFSCMLPDADPHAIEFLESTLRYNPAKRLSASECLLLPLFRDI